MAYTRMPGLLVALMTLVCIQATARQLQQSPDLPGPPGNCSIDVIQGIKWGVATASYQVEGGWNLSGRTQSIWDNYTHDPTRSKVYRNETGDVAADMYHRYPEDFALMHKLGVKHYRFSISWNRIVPQAFANTTINPAGVKFYNDMLDSMLSYNITPYVTMFHWDLPQALQTEYGGFVSRRLIDDYLYYADALFANFGNRVKNWITFNEPSTLCVLHYGTGQFGGIPAGGYFAQYHCGHNLLLAHGRTVQLYRSKYQPQQNGRITITLNVDWAEPTDPTSAADQRASNNSLQNNFGWWADPIYFGDYPASLKGAVAANGNASDLPEFTPEESQMMRGSVDYQGVNHYTTGFVTANGTNPYGYNTTEVAANGKPIGPQAASPWLFDVPWGFYKLLKWINARYHPTEILITENGWSEPNETNMTVPTPALNDTGRIHYYNGYLNSLCRAASEGVNITHYFAWSYCDNFEWNDAYSIRFGIVRVNYFEPPLLERNVKDSGYWFSKNFFRSSA